VGLTWGLSAGTREDTGARDKKRMVMTSGRSQVSLITESSTSEIEQ